MKRTGAHYRASLRLWPAMLSLFAAPLLVGSSRSLGASVFSLDGAFEATKPTVLHPDDPPRVHIALSHVIDDHCSYWDVRWTFVFELLHMYVSLLINFLHIAKICEFLAATGGETQDWSRKVDEGTDMRELHPPHAKNSLAVYAAAGVVPSSASWFRTRAEHKPNIHQLSTMNCNTYKGNAVLSFAFLKSLFL
jgi:hypothetical protein